MTRSNDILQVRVSFPVTLSLTSLLLPVKGKTLPKLATFSTHCEYQIRSPRQFQVESFEKRPRMEGRLLGRLPSFAHFRNCHLVQQSAHLWYRHLRAGKGFYYWSQENPI